MALLVIWWLLHVGVNLVWLKVDTRPPFWDTAGHAITAIQFSRLPFVQDFSTALRGLLTTSRYPPLVYGLSAFLAVPFWPTTDVFNAVHALFLGVLLLSVYAIGREFGGRQAGLLAAFVVSMYPLIYGLERHYLLDVPLVAMVALSNWRLVCTDRFEQRGASLLYGLSLGLGMLTKWAFAIFALGPFLVQAVRLFSARSKRRWINMMLGLGAGAATAAPWHIYNFRSSLRFMSLMPIYGRAEGDPVIASLESWGYYLHAFIDDQVLLPFAVAFAIGLIALLRRPEFRHEAFLLASWIVVPYSFSSLSPNKDPRYTMPYLPAVAVITGLGLVLLQRRTLRLGLVGLLALYAMVQFAGLTWGPSSRLPVGLLPDRIALQIGPIPLPLYAEGVHIASPPKREDWQVQSVLHDALSSSNVIPKKGMARLVVLADAPCFEQNTFKYHALLDRLPIDVFTVAGVIAIPEAEPQVLASDYIVTKTGNLGPPWSIQQIVPLLEGLHDPSSELGQQFDLVREYSLPDGSVGELYENVSLK